MNRKVIEEDRRLEKAANETTGALMRHRWHWTLDESNPDRVSMREYARAVGKQDSLIRRYSTGYVLLREHAGVLTASEALERAGMGVETQAAVEAVAEAHDVSFKQARMTRYEEVKRVRDWAREAAERNETSVEDEAPRIAKMVVRSQEAGAGARERRKAWGFQYVSLESKLVKGRRALHEALLEAQLLEFDDDEVVEELGELIGKIRAILELLDMKMSGSVEIDWDQEFTKIGGEN